MYLTTFINTSKECTSLQHAISLNVLLFAQSIGFDKQNRPISWRKFGQFEIWNILKLTSMQQLINFHAWESEQLLRLMHDKSKETGSNIETFTVVVDASGWAISQATGDAFTFIKGDLLVM
jgi:CRAL/TRIO domain